MSGELAEGVGERGRREKIVGRRWVCLYLYVRGLSWRDTNYIMNSVSRYIKRAQNVIIKKYFVM